MRAEARGEEREERNSVSAFPFCSSFCSSSSSSSAGLPTCSQRCDRHSQRRRPCCGGKESQEEGGAGGCCREWEKEEEGGREGEEEELILVVEEEGTDEDTEAEEAQEELEERGGGGGGGGGGEDKACSNVQPEQERTEEEGAEEEVWEAEEERELAATLQPLQLYVRLPQGSTVGVSGVHPRATIREVRELLAGLEEEQKGEERGRGERKRGQRRGRKKKQGETHSEEGGACCGASSDRCSNSDRGGGVKSRASSQKSGTGSERRGAGQEGAYEMRLCYGGRDLEDGETVERYGMRNGATVFGLLRLLGGAISTGSAMVVDETVPPHNNEEPPHATPRNQEPPPASSSSSSPLTRRRVVVPAGKAEGAGEGGGGKKGEEFGRSASASAEAGTGGEKTVRGRRVRVVSKAERKRGKGEVEGGARNRGDVDEPAREEEYVEDPEEMEEGAVLMDPVQDFVQIREGLRMRGAKVTQAARPELDQAEREAYKAAPMRLKLGAEGGLLQGHYFDIPGSARPSPTVAEAPAEPTAAPTAGPSQPRRRSVVFVDEPAAAAEDQTPQGLQSQDEAEAEKPGASPGESHQKRRKSVSSRNGSRRSSLVSEPKPPALENMRYRQPRPAPEPVVIAAPAKAKKSRRALDMMLMEEKKKTITPRRRRVVQEGAWALPGGLRAGNEDLTITEQLVEPGLAPPWPAVPACRSKMMVCRSSNKAIRIKRLRFISGSDLLGRIQESQKTYTCVWKHSPGATYCKDFCFTHYISQVPHQKCWYVRRHRIVTIPNPNAGSARDYPIASQPLRNECAEKRGKDTCVRKSCIACKAAGREYVQPFGLVFDENGKFLPKNAPEHDHDLEQLIGGGDSPIAAGSPTSPTAQFAMRGGNSQELRDAKGWRRIRIQQSLNKSNASYSPQVRDFDITDIPMQQALAGKIPSATLGMGTEKDRNGVCCDAWPRHGKLDGDICYPLQDKMNDPNVRDLYGPLHVFQMRRGRWPSDPLKPKDRLEAIMGEKPKPQYPPTWHKPVSA